MATLKAQTLISHDIINSIHQSSKYLVFGYTRKINENSHELVDYLCLLFFIERNDEWQSKNKHFIMENRRTVKRITNYGFQSMYLRNVVKLGVHIWCFRFIENGFEDVIGIYQGNKPLITKDRHTQNNNDAYFLKFKHRSFNHQPGIDINAYNCRGQDLVEMQLNFKNLTLSFKMNNSEDHIKTFHVQNTSYRAFVKLSQKDTQISLISYQHIH